MKQMTMNMQSERITSNQRNHELVTISTVMTIVGVVGIFGSLFVTAYAQNITTNMSGGSPTTQPSASGEESSPLGNIVIDHAGGDFTSLQTDNENKTWITSGSWDLVSDPNSVNQTNSSTVNFNATIDMKGIDNSDGHKHQVSEFNLENSSIGSSDEGSVLEFNGTATIETDVGLYSDVPIGIKIMDAAPAIVIIDTQTNKIQPQWIPEGGTISLSIDERVEDHFGKTPIYGKVRKE
jgi:hypothetical protein